MHWSKNHRQEYTKNEEYADVDEVLVCKYCRYIKNDSQHPLCTIFIRLLLQLHAQELGVEKKNPKEEYENVDGGQT